jgi:hypothetical protein
LSSLMLSDLEKLFFLMLSDRGMLLSPMLIDLG